MSQAIAHLSNVQVADLIDKKRTTFPTANDWRLDHVPFCSDCQAYLERLIQAGIELPADLNDRTDLIRLTQALRAV